LTKAKINAPLGYDCMPNGYTSEHFPCGMTVEGKVAKWAVQDGAAVPINDPRDGTQAATSAPETKAPRKRGRPRKKADD